MVAPAADRNKAPISETLKKLKPFDKPADVLEIGAGTGQHAAFLSTELSVNSWQPTEYDDVNAKSRKDYESGDLDTIMIS